MSEISAQALERKKRRLELKANAGNIRALRRDVAQRPWQLWFDDQGNIITFTQDQNVKPKEHWISYKFEQDQLDILKDKNIATYKVVEDDKVKGVYRIEVRKLEHFELNADNQFLKEITYIQNPSTEVLCTLSSDSFTVALGKSVIEEYIDIKPKDAQKGNQRSLVFYLTYPSDPHILFHEFRVTLEELLSKTVCTIPLSDNYIGCGVFTKKVFESYTVSEIRDKK